VLRGVVTIVNGKVATIRSAAVLRGVVTIVNGKLARIRRRRQPRTTTISHTV